VDYGTGAQAALAIVAALFQRTQTGIGQKIDVSMTDAALMLMSSHVTDTLTNQENPSRVGNSHPHYAGYATFEAKEGLLMIGAWTNKQIAALFSVLGETDHSERILQAARTTLNYLCDEDNACIAAHIKTNTADYWEALLNDAHIPAARVRQLTDALEHAQTEQRSVLQSSHIHIPDGPKKLPVAAFNYAHGSPTITRPPPQLGEHNVEILKELGLNEDEISHLEVSAVICSSRTNSSP